VLDLEAEEEAHLELPVAAVLPVVFLPEEAHADAVRLAGEVGGADETVRRRRRPGACSPSKSTVSGIPSRSSSRLGT